MQHRRRQHQTIQRKQGVIADEQAGLLRNRIGM
jgi:hypothetical protein